MPPCIDAHIDLLNTGLAHIKQKTDAEWEVEDVIESVRQQRAFLFVVDEGFFILTPQYNPARQQIDVVCKAAYAHSHAPNESLIAKYMPDVEALCREVRATRLLFNSPRRGFERLPGVRISTVVYEKDVSYG